MINPRSVLIAYRAADVFRTRLGLGGWERIEDAGWGKHWPTAGHLFVFRAPEGSDELARHGIRWLKVNVIVPTSVYADVEVEELDIIVALHAKEALVCVPMEPSGYRHETWDEDEIAFMCREYESFRLVMEAIKEAEERLKAEVESQEEEG